MSINYIDKTGLAYLVTKIKMLLADKLDKTGNAATATTATTTTGNAGSATKLQTARTITLNGDVAGSVSTDFSTNPTMSVTVVDNSHTHDISSTVTGNLDTSRLREPAYVLGSTTVTARPLFDVLRGDRTAFLPASQIIIEQSTDAGVTWVNAGVSDTVKTRLFTGQRPTISIPLKNGVKSTDCMIRITITGMRYNVPDGTSEIEKYNYWNSSYILSTERYFTAQEGWAWVSSNSDRIYFKAERATGVNSTSWATDREGYMVGWSGGNYFSLSGNNFGGFTSQTGNYWNWRFTFRTCSNNNTFKDADLSTIQPTTTQVISHIKISGQNVWTVPNNYMYNDHLYTWDEFQDAIFPTKVQGTQLISTIATGTPPLAVTSTTKVANLNAEKLDGRDSAYYLSRTNHTGTQTSSTISDFALTVLGTVLTGLSTATNAVISATDTVLSALGKLQAQITANLSTLTNHTSNTSNPHSVTKTQVGLGSVDNTADATKKVLSATKLATARTISLTGDVTGSVSTDFSTNPTISVTVADDSHNHIISNVDNLQTTLNIKADLVDGKVPSSQLPSFVDDVLEYATLSAFPVTGTSGIIYVDLSTNLAYRWSGTVYVEISPSLALGETSSTAYRGDRGAIAYNHSLSTSNPHSTTASQVGLGNVPNVTTNNQTPSYTMASGNADLVSGETLTIAFGKIARSINSLIAHIADNIRHITSTERTNWNVSYTNNHTHSNKTILDNTTASYIVTDKTKLDGIESGAQVNDITGVKGDSEGSYRVGNVNITKANIGLGSVDNTSDATKPVSTPQQTVLNLKLDKTGDSKDNVITFTQATTLANVATGEKHSVILGKVAKAIADFITHKNSTANPHSVNKTQVGLGSVDNTADTNKNVLSATKLTTARTIALSGGATGTATSFNGSANITIPVTSLDATKLLGTASISTTGNASTATTATKDASGNIIAPTYIKALSASGSTITYTKGDGTTGTVDVGGSIDARVVVAATNTAIENTAAALTNGNVFLNTVYNGAVTSSHKIYGAGSVNVVTDAYANINIMLGWGSATNAAETPITALGSGDLGYVVSGSPSGVVDTPAALTNGSVYLNMVKDNLVLSSHKLSGDGAIEVLSDASGNIVVRSKWSDIAVN